MIPKIYLIRGWGPRGMTLCVRVELGPFRGEREGIHQLRMSLS